MTGLLKGLLKLGATRAGSSRPPEGSPLAGARQRLVKLAEGISVLKPRETLSITIEHGFIKMLVTRDMEVVDFRTLMVSPQFFREGLVADRARVAGVMQNAIKELGPVRRKMIGAVPGFQNTLRILQLPRARGLDPAVVIPAEARKIMGVSPETTRLTWHRLPDAVDRSRWLVMAEARRSIASLLETTQRAGLRLSELDLRPFALARALNRSEAIVAWLAPDGCEVVIVKDSIPVQQQSLFWGAASVEGTVLVERVSEMMERAIGVYNESYTETPISEQIPVFVTGTPINVEPEVAERVASNLRRPSGSLNPPLSHSPDFPIHDLIVNVGLALREG